MTQRAPKIGVVGAGIAGLHLGLLLQQAGIEATIFTEHTPEQVTASLPAKHRRPLRAHP